MQFVPAKLWKQFFQIFLGLINIFTFTQTPSLCQSVYVSVNRKCRHSECLAHDNRCRLVPYPWQGFKCFKRLRHNTIVLIHQDIRQLYNCPRFTRRKTTGLDNFFHAQGFLTRHIMWIVSKLPQCGCHFINPFICTLS